MTGGADSVVSFLLLLPLASATTQGTDLRQWVRGRCAGLKLDRGSPSLDWPGVFPREKLSRIFLGWSLLLPLWGGVVLTKAKGGTCVSGILDLFLLSTTRSSSRLLILALQESMANRHIPASLGSCALHEINNSICLALVDVVTCRDCQPRTICRPHSKPSGASFTELEADREMNFLD
jgi:hypothetical protein